MNKEIENIIKKNLPEERTQDNLPFENSPEIYGNQRIEAYKNGFTQAISSIDTSLIADEVLKVVVEKINKKMDEYEYHKDEIHCTCLGALREFLKESSNLSHNKNSIKQECCSECWINYTHNAGKSCKNSLCYCHTYTKGEITNLNNYRLFLIDYLKQSKVYVGVFGTEKDNSWNSAIEKIIDKLKYEINLSTNSSTIEGEQSEHISTNKENKNNENTKQLDSLTKEDLINYIRYLEDSRWQFMEEKVLEAEMSWNKLLDKSNKKLKKYRTKINLLIKENKNNE